MSFSFLFFFFSGLGGARSNKKKVFSLFLLHFSLPSFSCDPTTRRLCPYSQRNAREKVTSTVCWEEEELPVDSREEAPAEGPAAATSPADDDAEGELAAPAVFPAAACFRAGGGGGRERVLLCCCCCCCRRGGVGGEGGGEAGEAGDGGVRGEGRGGRSAACCWLAAAAFACALGAAPELPWLPPP